MNETSKTVAFVVSAALLGIAAGWSHWMTKPKPVDGFEKVGQEFFPEFQDATEATSLSVTAYDEETESLQEFSVMFKDGLWRIPSHHDYPAEAADRLARTATSLIGLVRESNVARRVSKHAEHGVVAPDDEEVEAESAGQRITLKNEDGEILADYIIGKPADSVEVNDQKTVRDIGQDSDYFFVRVPSEKETYKAKIEIDLSTRFTDWINPDLLKLEPNELNRLEIDNYELVEEPVTVGNRQVTQLRKNVLDKQVLTKEEFGGWELDGLDAAKEELDTLQVESVVGLLDEMKIAGVRPKVKIDGHLLVKSDLTINQDLRQKYPVEFYNSRVLELQRDLEQKGFTIGQTTPDPSSVSLLGSRGELQASTQNGVRYTLYFGRSVSGDLADIEIGAAVDSSADSKQEDSKKESNGQAENDTADSEPNPDNKNRSRYVAIRVDFDPGALGEAPVLPTEPAAPTKPDGYDEWKAEQDKSTADANANSEDKDDKEVDQTDDGPPKAPEDIEKSALDDYLAFEQAMAVYEKDSIQYSTDLELYDTNKKGYDGRKQNGEELVAELNDRFAEWFYVVPAESLATLKLSRNDLVKPKYSPASSAGTPQPGQLPVAPDIDFSSSDTANPKSEEKPPSNPTGLEPETTESKKASEQPEAGSTKVENTAAEESESGETPTVEKENGETKPDGEASSSEPEKDSAEKAISDQKESAKSRKAKTEDGKSGDSKNGEGG